LGGKRKKKKGKKESQEKNQLLSSCVNLPPHATRSAHTPCHAGVLGCSNSGTNPWFVLLVMVEAPDILEDNYYSNYSS